MTKFEEYNLTLDRYFLSNGLTRRYAFSKVENNPYWPLTFINVLEQCEIQFFIESITLANNDQIYDPNFFKQEGTEACSIEFNKPYFNIDGLTIHMIELQQLLREWLIYVNA